jgi:hypothetical protein
VPEPPTQPRAPAPDAQPPSGAVASAAEQELETLRTRAASLARVLQSRDDALALEHDARIAAERVTKLLIGIALALIGVTVLVGAWVVMPAARRTRDALASAEGTLALERQRASAERSFWQGRLDAAQNEADRLASELARLKAAATDEPSSASEPAVHRPRFRSVTRQRAKTPSKPAAPPCECAAGDPLCACMK